MRDGEREGYSIWRRSGKRQWKNKEENMKNEGKKGKGKAERNDLVG